MRKLALTLILLFLAAGPSHAQTFCDNQSTGLELPIPDFNTRGFQWGTCMKNSFIKINDGLVSTTTFASSTNSLQGQIDDLDAATATLTTDKLARDGTQNMTGPLTVNSSATIVGALEAQKGLFASSTTTGEHIILGVEDDTGTNIFKCQQNGRCGFNLGAATPDTELHLEGRLKYTSSTINSVPYQWPLTQATTSQLLMNDGAGNLSWATVGGVSPVQSTVTFTNTIAFTNPSYDCVSGSTRTISVTGGCVEIRLSATVSNTTNNAETFVGIAFDGEAVSIVNVTAPSGGHAFNGSQSVLLCGVSTGSHDACILKRVTTGAGNFLGDGGTGFSRQTTFSLSELH